ncbi:NADH dehydrogenase [ubiquinone] 1 alpha subcomplex subunit 3 [Nematolebias whitei]|uniref:NADH dehydrogenase [ubiquinone] 1 alpha subcomplex subunit 3 n=1 Tax=Nematolebias whitei TaxID=451745 RepID=UPI001899B9C8|nr:NADH dehydrogenase [ubiquinone] 1 alpha subcomplex subunit 3 [Nematolebias whitei]
MAAKLGAYLKNVWDKQPILVVSGVIIFASVVVPFVSPYTKYTAMINQAMPYTYPIPVRDDGNMPDIPAHPSDPQGKNLDWLKDF